jgi:hypothetical protein
MKLPFGLGRRKVIDGLARRSQAAARPEPDSDAVQPRVRLLVLGDSHCHAISLAHAERPADGPVMISVRRFAKVKNGNPLGDIDMPAALDLVRTLRPSDALVSVVGGNQYNSIGLIQHPRPFQVLSDESSIVPPGSEIIPRRVLLDVFENGLRGRDGTKLRELRAAARCRVYHLVPPPPKEDLDHILRHHESNFAKAGILDHGVTPAPLRLALWSIQTEAIQAFCRANGIVPVLPPREAVDAAGFLHPTYYARDATHANRAYGELVLRMLERVALHEAEAGDG